MAQPKAKQATAETIVVHSPIDGSVVDEVPVFTQERVDAEIVLAHEAQRAWAALPPKERGRRLKKWRDLVLDDADALAELVTLENGKTRTESVLAEVATFAQVVTYFGRRSHKILKPRSITLFSAPHRTSYVHYVPRGVIGIIAPWNFPVAIAMGEAAMALLAGNAAVVKPSEITPLSALWCKKKFDEAGLDPNLLRIVTGYGETGSALLQGDVQMICFTGSVATGRKIAAACGERLIPCIVELGGKAPFIVCQDADLDRAARAAVFGAFFNSGQVCASTERVYVHREVAEGFTTRVIELTRKLRQGDPRKFDVDIGAITFDRQIEVAREQIDDAVSKGATVATGGEAHQPVEGGSFFQPTVLTGVTQDMKVAREETFGPLLPILVVDSEEEALQLANDSHLGLMGYVFTRDIAKGKRYAEQLEIGTVMVNDVLSSYAFPEAPWMGVKQSGLGKVHSADGLRDLCQERHVNLPKWWLPSTRKDPHWHPHSRKLYDLALRALRLLKRL